MTGKIETLIDRWEPLGAVDPDTLAGARNQLHWAAQIPASIGYTYVQPEPDWSHTSLSSLFLKDEYVLVSHAAAEEFGSLACGICLETITLFLFDGSGDVSASFELDGKTLDQGYTWLEAQIEERLGVAARRHVRPNHELPAHPVGKGASFSLNDGSSFRELAGWYTNAERALQSVRATHPEAAPIRCWPHHFDLASLLKLDPAKHTEEARSIGVGFVPGDGSYDEPYFYITPWPYPDTAKLPFLEGGHWHTEGWTGAVLVASELIEAGDSSEEVLYLLDFLDSGIAACRQLLEG